MDLSDSPVDAPGAARQEPAMGKVEARPGEVVRKLLRAADRAALATRLAGEAGTPPAAWPFASLVLLACDHDATPLLLMSDLAEHSKNIAADPRLSLLIDGTAGRVDPLTGPRVTLLGTAERTADARLKARFLARHPSAALYADFGDFHLYRVGMARAHFVAGFGRIHWLDAADFMYAPGADGSLAAAETALLEELTGQADLADSLAQRVTGRRARGWRITGIDPEGIDLRRGGSIARAAFSAPAGSTDDVARMVRALLRAETTSARK
jgi:putative heme iron utilization protein